MRQLHATVWESYASLDSTTAQSALDHTLPVPYPLNVRLYATLLLSTFGEDGKGSGLRLRFGSGFGLGLGLRVGLRVWVRVRV